MIALGPLTKRTIIFVVLPILIAISIFFFKMASGVPHQQYEEGSFPSRPTLSLYREDSGEPLIRGKTIEDIFFGLGVAHAQDRIWQMELLRRRASGRLSEVFGIDLLTSDKFSRTLGFYRQSLKDLEALSPMAISVLESYTAGVNEWLSLNPVLPLDFFAAGVKPEPWTMLDSLAINKVYAFERNPTFFNELTSQLLIQELGLKNARSLIPHLANVSAAQVIKAEPVTGLIRIVDPLLSLKKAYSFPGNEITSLAVVFNAGLTAANSTAVMSSINSEAKLPTPLYTVRMEESKRTFRGVTLPGVPLLMFGQNDHITWGGAYTQIDTQDLILETRSLNEPGEYFADGQWQIVTSNVEQIKVKSKPPAFLRPKTPDVDWQVRSTSNGPLLSDVLGIDAMMSLRWTAFENADTSFESLLRLSMAKDWETFSSAVDGLVAPPTTYVFADRYENYGLKFGGNVPLRSGHSGMIPLSGTNGNAAWRDIVERSDLPEILNPNERFLSTAHTSVPSLTVPEAYLDATSQNHLSRLEALLSEFINTEAKLDQREIIAIQTDTFSVSASHLLPQMLGYVTDTARRRDALERLERWEYRFDADSAAALLYSSWKSYLMAYWINTFYDRKLTTTETLAKLYTSGAINISDRALDDALDKLALMECPEIHKPCSNLIEFALDSAIRQVENFVGENLAELTDPQTLPVLYKHSMFGNANIVRFIFNRKGSIAGANDSLNLGVLPSISNPANGPVSVPSYRALHFSQKVEKGFDFIGSGHSENVFSEHYDYFLN